MSRLSGDTPRTRKQPVGITRFLSIRPPLSPCPPHPAPPQTARAVSSPSARSHPRNPSPMALQTLAKIAPKSITIRNWPESERPREKLLERGPQALSDAELVALLLGSGTKGRSAVDLARSLLAEFGSLREMLAADRQRWEGKVGIGPARYAALMASIEIARRH